MIRYIKILHTIHCTRVADQEPGSDPYSISGKKTNRILMLKSGWIRIRFWGKRLIGSLCLKVVGSVFDFGKKTNRILILKSGWIRIRFWERRLIGSLCLKVVGSVFDFGKKTNRILMLKSGRICIRIWKKCRILIRSENSKFL